MQGTILQEITAPNEEEVTKIFIKIEQDLRKIEDDVTAQESERTNEEGDIKHLPKTLFIFFKKLNPFFLGTLLKEDPEDWFEAFMQKKPKEQIKILNTLTKSFIQQMNMGTKMKLGQGDAGFLKFANRIGRLQQRLEGLIVLYKEQSESLSKEFLAERKRALERPVLPPSGPKRKTYQVGGKTYAYVSNGVVEPVSLLARISLSSSSATTTKITPNTASLTNSNNSTASNSESSPTSESIPKSSISVTHSSSSSSSSSSSTTTMTTTPSTNMSTITALLTTSNSSTTSNSTSNSVSKSAPEPSASVIHSSSSSSSSSSSGSTTSSNSLPTVLAETKVRLFPKPLDEKEEARLAKVRNQIDQATIALQKADSKKYDYICEETQFKLETYNQLVSTLNTKEKLKYLTPLLSSLQEELHLNDMIHEIEKTMTALITLNRGKHKTLCKDSQSLLKKYNESYSTMEPTEKRQHLLQILHPLQSVFNSEAQLRFSFIQKKIVALQKSFATSGTEYPEDLTFAATQLSLYEDNKATLHPMEKLKYLDQILAMLPTESIGQKLTSWASK